MNNGEYLILYIMHVLEFKNYEVVPTEECFMIKPIRELYNKDTSKNKEMFMKQLSIIYFMADPRSSYNYILDLDERFETIKEQEGLPKSFKIDKQLDSAIECYKQHTITASSLLLESTKIAVEKVRNFLKDIDLNKVDEKGKPIYTINSVTMAIKQIPQLAKDLSEAERAVAKEIEEVGRARGGNESKKAFEDGI